VLKVFISVISVDNYVSQHLHDLVQNLVQLVQLRHCA